MKNKLYYILIGLLISFSFMGSVFADVLDYTLTATPSENIVVKGNEVSIILNIKSNSSIDLCQFQVTSDSNLEFVSMNTITNTGTGSLWKIKDGAINDFTLKNELNSEGSLANGSSMIEFKYVVNGDGKVTIKNLSCTKTVDGVNDLRGTHSDLVVDIKSKDLSDDKSLSSLEVTGGTLDTPITSKADYYVIRLDSSTFGLKATASNSEYNDNIIYKDSNGNAIADPSNIKFVSDGGQTQMVMSIVVDNTTTYPLFISYVQPELNNSLTSITINGVDLVLEEGKYDYEYTVGKDVTSFEVEATLGDSVNFKFGENGNAPGSFSINDVVYVDIVVEPVSTDIGAEVSTYTIVVTRDGSLVEETPDNTGKEEVPDKDEDNKNPGGNGNSGTGNSGSGNSGSGNSGGSPNNGGTSGSGSNVNSNPGTGEISQFVMASILILSLVGSIILYQKNIEGYK